MADRGVFSTLIPETGDGGYLISFFYHISSFPSGAIDMCSIFSPPELSSHLQARHDMGLCLQLFLTARQLKIIVGILSLVVARHS